jgi:hypothetical protein
MFLRVDTLKDFTGVRPDSEFKIMRSERAAWIVGYLRTTTPLKIVPK